METELTFTFWVRAASPDKAAKALGRVAAQAGLEPELLGTTPHEEDAGLLRCRVRFPCPGSSPAEAVVGALRVGAAFADRWIVRAPAHYEGGEFDFQGSALEGTVRGPGLEQADFFLRGRG